MPSHSFWNGRKVLLTGHTGFKGSWLSIWLQELGAELVGFALEPPTDPSLFVLANVREGMVSHTGDIRDLDRLNRIFDSEQPQIVIHLAAQSLVRYSYEEPVETYATNVMGTVNLLEAVRRSDCVRAVLIVTTDKCYENREWVWPYRENEPLGGKDPYSSSKACAEILAASYRDSFFRDHNRRPGPVALATARAGNVIGGGDWAKDRLVPDFIRAFRKREPVLVRNPSSIRPWQHVLEPLAGYLILLERLWEDSKEFASAWNFAPASGSARPVAWIVEYLAGRWPGGAEWKIDSGPHPSEAHTLNLDGSKARAMLGVEPKLGIEEALNWVAEWYWAHQSGADLQQMTRNQIRKYECLLGPS